jgi:S1-C subfamily serine protease
MWKELSTEISEAVGTVGQSIVTVQAGGHRTSSGVVLDETTVVTTAHTISSEGDIQVWMSPKEPCGAQVVGRDSGTDLALLKADRKLGKAAPFAENPQLAIGQLVVAVARTWRGNLVASAGVLSGLMGEWHTYRGKKIEAFIRPDLTFYSGFSGGALIGPDQKIVGINTAALRRGSPLAIPYATVKRITSLLLEKGYVPSPYLGLGLQPVRVPESLRQKLNLTEHAGALVVHIEGGSPAEKAGLMLGDVVLRIQNRGLGEERTVDILSRLVPRETATVVALRAGQQFTSTVTVGERPRR